MAYQRRIGFFGLQIPGAASAYSAASAAWMFGSAPGSVRRFVEDSSGGEIELVVQTAALTPTAAQAAEILKMPLDRWPRLEACAAVARANGWNLGQFDCIVFGVWGGTCDTGAHVIWDDPPNAPGRWIPTCICDEIADHNMICHEVCHVIGLDHSFWPAINTGLAFGEYGDPTDVMSTSGPVAGAFDLLVDPAAGIAANGMYWKNAGPGIAMATLWRYLPGFPAAQPWLELIDPMAPPTTLVLQPAGAPPGGRPRLAAVPGDSGWWTFEYRRAAEWDRSLDDPSLPHEGPGIVVHRISDLGVGFALPGYPKLQQVQYVATIPVPPTGDLDWDNGQVGIRYVQHTDAGVQVRIGRSSNRSIRLVVAEPTLGPTTRSPGGVERVGFAGENCLPGDVVTERVSASATIVIQAQATGFADVRFRFQVKGIDAGSDAPLGTVESGAFTLPAVPVKVPKTRFTSTVQGRNIPITWVKNGNTLTLAFPPGHGTYPVPIRVRASESGTGEFHDHQEDIEVTTQWMVWPHRVTEKIAHCLRTLRRLYIERERIGPPIPVDGPDWSRFGGIDFYRHVAALRDAESADPHVAARLRQVVSDRHGLEPGALAELERMIER